ncbi:hypothetical protein [Pseudomonas sp. S2_E01]
MMAIELDWLNEKYSTVGRVEIAAWLVYVIRVELLNSIINTLRIVFSFPNDFIDRDISHAFQYQIN